MRVRAPLNPQSPFFNLTIPSGLRLIVLAFCAGLVASMWVWTAYLVSFERDYAVERRESENDNLARLFEEHVQRALAAPGIALKQLEAEYRQHGERLDLVRYMRDRRDELTSYSVLSVVDQDGNLVLASIPFVKPQNFRNVENFQFHMRDASPDVFIAKPRSGTITGRPTIYLTRRMNKADGTFGGYTLVGMDPKYFSSFYDEIDLGADSTVVLIGRDGVIRARRSNAPSSEEQVGRYVGGSALFSVHLKRAEHGRFRSTGLVDGVKRLVSFRSVKAYPLVVLVGVSEAAALASVRARISSYVWWASGMTAVILLFGILLDAQISRQARTNQLLREGEARLAEAQSIATLGSWEWNLVTGRVILSDEIIRILEIDRSQFGASYQAFLAAVHPEDRDAVNKAYTDSLANKSPYVIEHRLVMTDGRIKFVREQCHTEFDGSGKALRSMGIMQDITGRKRSEQLNAQLAAIVESSNDAILIRGPERTILSWNAAAERLFGWSAQEAIGQPIEMIVPPERTGTRRRSITGVARDESLIPVETTHLRKDGTRIATQVTFSPVKDREGKVVAHSYTVRDMSELKRKEEALRGYANRLRQMSHRLRTVEETERHAIARELHDRIGQDLSTLGLILGSLGAKLPQESLPAVAKPLQDMQGLLKSMVANVRNVMADLRPPVLDDYGLLAALRQLATEFARRNGIPAELSGVDPQPRLPSIVETAMYRISQEALNNIVKHAQAQNVEISLHEDSGRVMLDIADDGVGFDANATPTDHWGLATMRERAEAVGIVFRLESAPGTGTRIALESERAAT